MNMNRILVSLFSFTLIAISACTPVEDYMNDNVVDNEDTRRLIVVSEGQFGYGTSSLTTLSHTGETERDIFRKVNNRTMGDVAQSLTEIGDNYYVPLNNSRKIEVFSSDNFKSVETLDINYQSIPMYIQHLGGDSIAVSTQHVTTTGTDLHIMDINHGTERKELRRSFPIRTSSGQMVMSNGKLFIGGSVFTVFDLSNLTEEGARYITDSDGNELTSIRGRAPLLLDKNGNIWGRSASSIVCINPISEEVIHKIDVSSLGINEWTGGLGISAQGDKLYFNAHRTVYEIDINSPQCPDNHLFKIESDKDDWTIYYFGVSKENTMFMCEVLYGTLQLTRVYEYDMKGNMLREFLAGVFASFIHYE